MPLAVTAYLTAIAILGAVEAATATSAQQGRNSGLPAREFSQYVTMPDGVDIAVTVLMAASQEQDAKAPTIAEFTRYGRLTVESEHKLEAWRRAGFNCVLVDTRGSGASFGFRLAEVSPAERRDIGTIIDWIAVQPWSNGRVLVTGLSYDADTAEMATGTGRPALAGALIRHSEFDVYRQIVFPGGVAAKVGIDLWGQYTHARDIAESCLANARKCAQNPALAPVDGDADFSRLRGAIAAHQQGSRADQDFAGITFSDDYFPSGVSVSSIGASAVAPEIKVSAVPSQVWASWMDAGTVDSALERFNSFPATSTEVYIAAWTHGGAHTADPFFKNGGPVVMTPAEQFDTQLMFLKRVATALPVRRVIHYVALNSRTWRDTDRWPPRSLAVTTWYLSAQHRLARKPSEQIADDSQHVNFSSTSGSENRWRGNFFSGPINYGDRAQADKELLHYDTDPLPEARELIGNVVAKLAITIDRTDGALFVYLEDVAPSGRVTYLTEGELRLVHRKAEPSCLRSFRRGDALPVIPGQLMHASICLEPVAARVEARHRLRIAIAGADADTFARYPASGPLVVNVQLGGNDSSSIDIPSRPWLSPSGTL